MAKKWVVKMSYKLQEQGLNSDKINKAIKAEKKRLDKLIKEK